MRVSREQAAENRGKILQVAAQLFREKGFDGIGIADLMKQVGLTHGGFYGHFSSKEDLMAHACEHAVDELFAQNRTRFNEQGGGDYYQWFIENYLSCEHRDNPGRGCLMAALGVDAARQSRSVKHAFTQSFNRLLDSLAKILPAKHGADKRQQAFATLAMLVGAQVIARAVDDPGLSQEVLQAVSKKLN